MAKVIVADTGPLIALALVDLLPVLRELFDEVYVPEAVLQEATADMSRPGAAVIDGAFKSGLITSRAVCINSPYQELIELLDQGEAEALALADELNAIALVDERKGRKVAALHGIKVTGTAAILIQAKRNGLLDAVKPRIQTLSDHGYRLSKQLIDQVLQLCGEG
jgi:uncharacterized protein